MTEALTRIGIFDSGVGGLTVLKELRQSLPQVDFVYLGDTARVPYGIRSAETVCEYSLQNAQFLLDQGAQAIIVACNTASAYALELLQFKLDVPVLGVVEPGAMAAQAASSNGKVAVIATEATVRSEIYLKFLKGLDKNLQVKQKATPLFVPLVEEGRLEPEVLKPIFDIYFKDFEGFDFDTLILGCTHYPVLREAIQQHLGSGVTLVDSASALKSQLASQNLGNGQGRLELFVTDLTQRVEGVAQRVLGSFDQPLNKVHL